MKILLKSTDTKDTKDKKKLELHTKYMVEPESTAEEVSFEWSHNWILSIDSKVRTTLNTVVQCESTAEMRGFI